MLRRNFLRNTGLAGAALAAGLPADGMPGGGREFIDAHKALRAAQGRLDNLRGASAVYASATDHHRQVLAWRAAAPTTAERQRIAALAADTGGFVGFLSHDLGLHDRAVWHYRDAVEHAGQAGDLSQRVNLLGQMSRIVNESGHYSGARALTDEALSLAGTKAHPAVRCWLHAVRAHHHACLADTRACQSDLSAAWRLLARADDGEIPLYIGYLDAAEINKWVGHASLALSRFTPALLRPGRTAVQEAQDAWPAAHVRGRAELLTVQARLHLVHGERDIAAEFAARAVAIARNTGSARNLRAALTALPGRV
ncbi:twin-arginine translocation signal domain-containing protein [Actinoallomurus iriomotensis]|uniref:Transcriptional regulator n=1 Tax=Actinoallomurus iriomotensis TaxID=478107 RepID=A0A9W6S651_9ACTN|nr:twin-arginine translocation signal domain-containing protein [Actinoallomurus iriomotensis]GLY89085.1 hypothetical protein Airi02_070140 [Actinoallomurus iriomotensis]